MASGARSATLMMVLVATSPGRPPAIGAMGCPCGRPCIRLSLGGDDGEVGNLDSGGGDGAVGERRGTHGEATTQGGARPIGSSCAGGSGEYFHHLRLRHPDRNATSLQNCCG